MEPVEPVERVERATSPNLPRHDSTEIVPPVQAQTLNQTHDRTERVAKVGVQSAPTRILPDLPTEPLRPALPPRSVVPTILLMLASMLVGAGLILLWRAFAG